MPDKNIPVGQRYVFVTSDAAMVFFILFAGPTSPPPFVVTPILGVLIGLVATLIILAIAAVACIRNRRWVQTTLDVQLAARVRLKEMPSSTGNLSLRDLQYSAYFFCCLACYLREIL